MSRNGLLVRAWHVVVATLGLFVLGSCGGGETLEPFRPTRIIVFGDEQSVLQPAHKFSVNFVDPTTLTPDCAQFPIWTQALASSFGMAFPECPGNVAQPQGITWAQSDTKVADLAGQIDQHLAHDTFLPTDLVTVFIGLHDLVDLFHQFPGRSRDALLADAQSLGSALGAQVNRIADADGRVLFVTIQDLSLSPLGLAQQPDLAQLLRDLTTQFNLSAKLSVHNDGRKIGLVALDGLTQQIVRDPLTNTFTNVTQAVCSGVALSDCTTLTLVPNGDGLRYLWADDTRLSAGGHARLSLAAQLRARRNPF